MNYWVGIAGAPSFFITFVHMENSSSPDPARPTGQTSGNYKWIALSNTTLGILMATINSSIVLISLPTIFRGIDLNPLTPENVSYLLWMLMGYMVVTAVLVVSLGRIGDMFGRVRMYNLGFLVFTLASVGLSLVLWKGPSAAILTDAFPSNQRGLALGVAYGASGGEVGRALSAALEVPLIERAIPPNLVERVATALAETIEEEETAREHPTAHLFEQLRTVSPLFGIQNEPDATGPLGAEDYRRLAVTAMNELANTTGAVVVGHGSAPALRSHPSVLRVAIGAPFDARVRRVSDVEGLDIRDARRKVELADSARRAYLRWLYDSAPDDPGLYHLVLDTSILSPDECVDTIMTAVRSMQNS